MNNNEFYERHDNRGLTEPSTPQPHADQDVDPLAVRRDPSVYGTNVEALPQAARPEVAWVRPSELPVVVGSGWVRRGIDLQSELVRRSRRAPVTTSRAVRRVSRSAIARPEPVSPTPADGIRL